MLAVSKTDLHPRGRVYYERLVKAFASELDRTSTAIRLWNACLEVFSESLTWAMDVAVDNIGRRGRSLAQIDELIRLIEAETDCYVDKYIFSDRTKFKHVKDRIERAAEIERVHSSDIYDDWCAAGDALVEIRRQLWGLQPLKKAKKSQLELNICNLCWRTGKRYRGDAYYCDLHKPSPGNVRYKTAKKTKTWLADSTDWDLRGRGYYTVRLNKLIRDIPTGIYRNDASLLLLMRLLIGYGDVNPIHFKQYAIDWKSIWSKLRYTRRYLTAHGVDISDTQAIIKTLDPIIQSHRSMQELYHEVLLKDQRHLVAILRLSEAWLETLLVRRGRGRHIANILSVAD